MKETKFRVRQNNNIVGFEWLDKNGKWINSIGGVIPNITLARDQYTGLKDKNDKEIYEADIIKFIAYDHFSGKKYNCIERVDNLDYTGFHPLNRDDDINIMLKTRYIFKQDVLKCVVIGNIYDNPELLEEQ